MSTTPGERKALLFLGAVAVLGAGARLAHRDPVAAPPSASELASLERQISASDSAAAHDRRRSGKRPRKARGDSAAPVGSPTVGRADAPVADLAPRAHSPLPTPRSPLDVDRASAADLEALPGIGPALARRIVEERERGGAFGNMEGLMEVKGIGPALVARLGREASVTFSGPPRPSRAAGPRAQSDTAVVRAGRRRGRHPARADSMAPR